MRSGAFFRQTAAAAAAWSLALLLLGTVALAQTVVPSDRVVSGVLVRAEPSTSSEILDALTPGESLPLVGEVPGWRQVVLPDGRRGYISGAWSVVVPLAIDGPVYRVHVVDVGTGLGVFVEGPDFTLVYDAGSMDDKAVGSKNRFWAYLRRANRDLRQINHVVLSHAHQDHIVLLPDLFSAYKVRNVWDSGRWTDSCVYRRFLDAVGTSTGVIWHEVKRGPGPVDLGLAQACGRPAGVARVMAAAPIGLARVPLGRDASMTFLHLDAEQHHDLNANSLVARLDIGGVSILLAGDAEGGEREDPPALPHPTSVEAKLIRCCGAALRAQVLVVGHHGSTTSSRVAFLDAVGADTFVISSGPYKYKTKTLPDPPIVRLLEGRGDLFRTDLDDATCRNDPAKIGSDADNKVGGCDNVLITVRGGRIDIGYNRLSD